MSKSRCIKRSGCLSIDRYMIYCCRNWGRRHARLHRLLNTTHHVIHSTGNVLTDSTADRHACHHSSHVESCAITATTDVYITGSVCSHLTESLCTSHANLCLLLNLESTEVRRLSLLMLCILTFFTLNAESTFIVFGFNTLFCVNVPDFCFCFGFCSSTCEFLGYAHKLTIAFAGLVNFNRTNINTRYNDTERLLGLRQMEAQLSLSMLPTEFKDAFLVALTRQCR